MILLHGLCSNAHYWDFFANAMKEDYHILSLDQRGHGDSDWPGKYGPKHYIPDLESFVTSLGLHDFIIVGHSMGGINAIAYAVRFPNLVKALVIVDIGPEIDKAGIERMKRERALEPEHFASEEEAISCMKRSKPHQSDEFIRHQAKYAMRKDMTGNFSFKYDKLLHSFEIRSPTWLWEYLGQVICPTLLVHGAESDILLLETAQKMADRLIDGTIVDIDHAGHGVPGDCPDMFETTVRKFLQNKLNIES
jgi:pimeloyl-ACP methyl ester carboxylesterase